MTINPSQSRSDISGERGRLDAPTVPAPAEEQQILDETLAYTQLPPAEQAGKDRLTKDDPVGWYECDRRMFPDRGRPVVLRWNGSFLECDRGYREEYYANFRGPLVVQAQPSGERGRLEGKTPWEFACGWYSPDEIERCIAGNRSEFGQWNNPPEDIHGRKFAEWMAHEYRLAMRKGIEIGIVHASMEVIAIERQLTAALAAQKDAERLLKTTDSDLHRKNLRISELESGLAEKREISSLRQRLEAAEGPKCTCRGIGTHYVDPTGCPLHSRQAVASKIAAAKATPPAQQLDLKAERPTAIAKELPDAPGVWCRLGEKIFWIVYDDGGDLCARAIGTEGRGSNGPSNLVQFQLPRGGWLLQVQPSGERSRLDAGEREEFEQLRKVRWPGCLKFTAMVNCECSLCECEKKLITTRQRLEAAEAFKTWVHSFLDGKGVPHDPDPEENARCGCRIGGRMRWLFAKLATAEAKLNRVPDVIADLRRRGFHTGAAELEALFTTDQECL